MLSEDAISTLVTKFIEFETNLLKLFSFPVVPEPTTSNPAASNPTMTDATSARTTVTGDAGFGELLTGLQNYLNEQTK